MFVYSATHESRGISVLSVKYHMYLSKYTQIVKDEERESTENRHTEREQEITVKGSRAERKQRKHCLACKRPSKRNPYVFCPLSQGCKR